jgi:phage-related minor tail protein
MAWTIFAVPSAKRAELDAALKDDVVSRQSQKVRDAAAMGGPSDQTYVLVEGSTEGVARAKELLTGVGTALAPAEAETLHQRFRDEEDAASAGMGLFFTEE